MLTEKQFEGLKKTNLSIDASKSKERISTDFKNASSDVKKKIVELSGLTRATFYNAFKSGMASPKVVLALAQSLDTSPYYYTGEADEQGVFNDDVLNNFMKEKKLNQAAKKSTTANKAKSKTKSKTASVKKTAAAKTAKKKAVVVPAEPKKRGRKPANAAASKTPTAKPATKTEAKRTPKSAPVTAKKDNEILMQISIEKSAKLQKAVANLDEETAVLLFRALLRKADANDNARTLCDIIKSCLLS